MHVSFSCWKTHKKHSVLVMDVGYFAIIKLDMGDHRVVDLGLLLYDGAFVRLVPFFMDLHLDLDKMK